MPLLSDYGQEGFGKHPRSGCIGHVLQLYISGQ